MTTILLIAVAAVAIFFCIDLTQSYRRKKRMEQTIKKLNDAVQKAKAAYAAQTAVVREQAAKIDAQAAEIAELNDKFRLINEFEAQVSAAADALNFDAPFDPSGN